MKNLLLLTAVLLLLNTSSQACDNGCTDGSHYKGILPQVKPNFLGVRYLNNSYAVTQNVTHTYEGITETYTKVSENSLNTAELWARYTPVKGIYVFVFVPYRFNDHHSNTADHNTSGPGDISVLANYALLNTGDSLNHKIKHTLRLGGGIKLATGSSNPAKGQGMPASMLPGTGSTDYILTGMYTIRCNKVGITTDATYNLTSENSRDYKFGNKLSLSCATFYWEQAGTLTLLPTAGLYYERAARDEVKHVENIKTGGESFFTNLGLQVYKQQIALGATWQKNLSTTTNRDTKHNNRAVVNLAYMF